MRKLFLIFIFTSFSLLSATIVTAQEPGRLLQAIKKNDMAEGESPARALMYAAFLLNEGMNSQWADLRSSVLNCGAKSISY